MMPLTLADTGATYTILKVGGKPEVRAHLNDLGFVAGGDVQVITDMMGNLIVNVKETRVAFSKKWLPRSWYKEQSHLLCV